MPGYRCLWRVIPANVTLAKQIQLVQPPDCFDALDIPNQAAVNQPGRFPNIGAPENPKFSVANWDAPPGVVFEVLRNARHFGSGPNRRQCWPSDYFASETIPDDRTRLNLNESIQSRPVTSAAAVLSKSAAINTP